MTPHVVTDTESVTDTLTGDIPDETTQQGYHRKISYIECECGERFTGAGHARSDFEDHIETAKYAE